MITFETLKSIQKQEKKTNSLSQPGNDFFREVDEYFESKKTFLEKLAEKGQDTKIHEMELKNAQEILIDIYNLRERKILEQSRESARMSAQKGSMIIPETRMFAEISAILDRNRGEVLAKILQKSQTERVKKDKIEMKRVKFTHDFPSFLGMDEKEYGPFKAGDVVELPRSNAEALIKAKASEHSEDQK